MTEPPVYLDFNATAPLRDSAQAAMGAAMALTGNPSSVHGPGRQARAAVEDARLKIARCVGATAEEIIFTSGGSEANALALHGAPVRSFAVSAIEHSSIIEPARADGRPCLIVAADQDGRIDLERLKVALQAAPKPALVAVMLANNETGVIQPLADVVRLARSHDALVLCDAVQALGKLPVDFRALDVDLLSLSAHKLGGPKGCGALVARAGLGLTPLLTGGGQERGRRAGTENVIGIAGFGAVVEAARADDPIWNKIKQWRDDMEAALKALAPELTIYGEKAPRLANTSCFGLNGLAAETQVMALDLAGIAVSAGSACSSGKITPSHVLSAMGAAAGAARSAIRVSFGWASRPEDGARLVRAWGAHLKRVAA